MTSALSATQQLIEGCQGLVRSLALKMHRRLPPHVELDDLIAYGQLGLAEAAHDFNPERGIQFSTYAYYRIRGAMYDGLAKMSWLSRSRYQRLRYEQQADQVLAADLDEYGDSTAGSTEDDARWLVSLAERLAVVYLSSQGDEGGRGDDQLADPHAPSPAETAELHEICQQLRLLIEALPAEAGQLIRATYFEGLSQQEAAQRLGVSKSWASRLHAKTLERLGRALRQLGLVD